MGYLPYPEGKSTEVDVMCLLSLSARVKVAQEEMGWGAGFHPGCRSCWAGCSAASAQLQRNSLPTVL